MKVSIIVAAAKNGVIGRAGGLPWDLPDEMAHFRTTTSGHPVIMGRKTHEAIGRALPKRQNIVISSDPGYRAEGCDTATSLKQAIAKTRGEEVFVIGGSSVFNEALPLANRIYLTQVDAEPDGDTYFNFDPTGWRKLSDQRHEADNRHKYAFNITVWEKP